MRSIQSRNALDAQNALPEIHVCSEWSDLHQILIRYCYLEVQLLDAPDAMQTLREGSSTRGGRAILGNGAMETKRLVQTSRTFFDRPRRT